MTAGRTKLSLLLFIVIVLASGWIGVWVDKKLPDQPEGNSPGMGLWLILPMIAMLVLRLVNRDWKDIGVRFNFRENRKWYGAAIAVYPVIMVIVVGLALLFNSASTSEAELHTILSLVGVSLAGSFVKNIFEEFAWRGYLTPKLIEPEAEGLDDLSRIRSGLGAVAYGLLSGFPAGYLFRDYVKMGLCRHRLCAHGCLVHHVR